MIEDNPLTVKHRKDRDALKVWITYNLYAGHHVSAARPDMWMR